MKYVIELAGRALGFPDEIPRTYYWRDQKDALVSLYFSDAWVYDNLKEANRLLHHAEFEIHMKHSVLVITTPPFITKYTDKEYFIKKLTDKRYL